MSANFQSDASSDYSDNYKFDENIFLGDNPPDFYGRMSDREFYLNNDLVQRVDKCISDANLTMEELKRKKGQCLTILENLFNEGPRVVDGVIMEGKPTCKDEQLWQSLSSAVMIRTPEEFIPDLLSLVIFKDFNSTVRSLLTNEYFVCVARDVLRFLREYSQQCDSMLGCLMHKNYIIKARILDLYFPNFRVSEISVTSPQPPRALLRQKIHKYGHTLSVANDMLAAIMNGRPFEIPKSQSDYLVVPKKLGNSDDPLFRELMEILFSVKYSSKKIAYSRNDRSKDLGYFISKNFALHGVTSQGTSQQSSSEFYKWIDNLLAEKKITKSLRDIALGEIESLTSTTGTITRIEKCRSDIYSTANEIEHHDPIKCAVVKNLGCASTSTPEEMHSACALLKGLIAELIVCDMLGVKYLPENEKLTLGDYLYENGLFTPLTASRIWNRKPDVMRVNKDGDLEVIEISLRNDTEGITHIHEEFFQKLGQKVPSLNLDCSSLVFSNSEFNESFSDHPLFPLLSRVRRCFKVIKEIPSRICDTIVTGIINISKFREGDSLTREDFGISFDALSNLRGTLDTLDKKLRYINMECAIQKGINITPSEAGDRLHDYILEEIGAMHEFNYLRKTDLEEFDSKISSSLKDFTSPEVCDEFESIVQPPVINAHPKEKEVNVSLSLDKMSPWGAIHSYEFTLSSRGFFSSKENKNEFMRIMGCVATHFGMDFFIDSSKCLYRVNRKNYKERFPFSTENKHLKDMVACINQQIEMKDRNIAADKIAYPEGPPSIRYPEPEWVSKANYMFDSITAKLKPYLEKTRSELCQETFMKYLLSDENDGFEPRKYHGLESTEVDLLVRELCQASEPSSLMEFYSEVALDVSRQKSFNSGGSTVPHDIIQKVYKTLSKYRVFQQAYFLQMLGRMVYRGTEGLQDSDFTYSSSELFDVFACKFLSKEHSHAYPVVVISKKPLKSWYIGKNEDVSKLGVSHKFFMSTRHCTLYESAMMRMAMEFCTLIALDGLERDFMQSDDFQVPIGILRELSYSCILLMRAKKSIEQPLIQDLRYFYLHNISSYGQSKELAEKLIPEKHNIMTFHLVGRMQRSLDYAKGVRNENLVHLTKKDFHKVKFETVFGRRAEGVRALVTALYKVHFPYNILLSSPKSASNEIAQEVCKPVVIYEKTKKRNLAGICGFHQTGSYNAEKFTKTPTYDASFISTCATASHRIIRVSEMKSDYYKNSKSALTLSSTTSSMVGEEPDYSPSEKAKEKLIEKEIVKDCLKTVKMNKKEWRKARDDLDEKIIEKDGLVNACISDVEFPCKDDFLEAYKPDVYRINKGNRSLKKGEITPTNFGHHDLQSQLAFVNFVKGHSPRGETGLNISPSEIATIKSMKEMVHNLLEEDLSVSEVNSLLDIVRNNLEGHLVPAFKECINFVRKHVPNNPLLSKKTFKSEEYFDKYPEQRDKIKDNLEPTDELILEMDKKTLVCFVLVHYGLSGFFWDQKNNISTTMSNLLAFNIIASAEPETCARSVFKRILECLNKKMKHAVRLERHQDVVQNTKSRKVILAIADMLKSTTKRSDIYATANKAASSPEGIRMKVAPKQQLGAQRAVYILWIMHKFLCRVLDKQSEMLNKALVNEMMCVPGRKYVAIWKNIMEMRKIVLFCGLSDHSKWGPFQNVDAQECCIQVHLAKIGVPNSVLNARSAHAIKCMNRRVELPANLVESYLKKKTKAERVGSESQLSLYPKELLQKLGEMEAEGSVSVNYPLGFMPGIMHMGSSNMGCTVHLAVTEKIMEMVNHKAESITQEHMAEDEPGFYIGFDAEEYKGLGFPCGVSLSEFVNRLDDLPAPIRDGFIALVDEHNPHKSMYDMMTYIHTVTEDTPFQCCCQKKKKKENEGDADDEAEKPTGKLPYFYVVEFIGGQYVKKVLKLKIKHFQSSDDEDVKVIFYDQEGKTYLHEEGAIFISSLHKVLSRRSLQINSPKSLYIINFGEFNSIFYGHAMEIPWEKFITSTCEVKPVIGLFEFYDHVSSFKYEALSNGTPVWILNLFEFMQWDRVIYIMKTRYDAEVLSRPPFLGGVPSLRIVSSFVKDPMEKMVMAIKESETVDCFINIPLLKLLLDEDDSPSILEKNGGYFLRKGSKINFKYAYMTSEAQRKMLRDLKELKGEPSEEFQLLAPIIRDLDPESHESEIAKLSKILSSPTMLRGADRGPWQCWKLFSSALKGKRIKVPMEAYNFMDRADGVISQDETFVRMNLKEVGNQLCFNAFSETDCKLSSFVANKNVIDLQSFELFAIKNFCPDLTMTYKGDRVSLYRNDIPNVLGNPGQCENPVEAILFDICPAFAENHFPSLIKLPGLSDSLVRIRTIYSEELGLLRGLYKEKANEKAREVFKYKLNNLVNEVQKIQSHRAKFSVYLGEDYDGSVNQILENCFFYKYKVQSLNNSKESARYHVVDESNTRKCLISVLHKIRSGFRGEFLMKAKRYSPVRRDIEESRLENTTSSLLFRFIIGDNRENVNRMLESKFGPSIQPMTSRHEQVGDVHIIESYSHPHFATVAVGIDAVCVSTNALDQRTAVNLITKCYLAGKTVFEAEKRLALPIITPGSEREVLPFIVSTHTRGCGIREIEPNSKERGNVLKVDSPLMTMPAFTNTNFTDVVMTTKRVDSGYELLATLNDTGNEYNKISKRVGFVRAFKPEKLSHNTLMFGLLSMVDQHHMLLDDDDERRDEEDRDNTIDDHKDFDTQVKACKEMYADLTLTLSPQETVMEMARMFDFLTIRSALKDSENEMIYLMAKSMIIEKEEVQRTVISLKTPCFTFLTGQLCQQSEDKFSYSFDGIKMRFISRDEESTAVCLKCQLTTVMIGLLSTVMDQNIKANKMRNDARSRKGLNFSICRNELYYVVLKRDHGSEHSVQVLLGLMLECCRPLDIPITVLTQGNISEATNLHDSGLVALIESQNVENED